MRILLFIACCFLWSCGSYQKLESSVSNISVPHKDKKLNIDSDKDGVVDYFDKCPETGKGISVDVKGCPKDTDGDGVPDHKDHQLITPSSCQPTDANGIGNCAGKHRPVKVCNYKFKPEWIGFSDLSYKLDANALKSIERFAKQMRRNPSFPILVIGYGNYSYAQQQVAWSRAIAVIKMLINKYGVDSNRIYMYYGIEGEDYLVQIKGLDASETKNPYRTLAPPYPGLIDEKNQRIRKAPMNNR